MKAGQKRKPTSGAIEIIHRRYYEGRPGRLAALDDGMVALKRSRQSENDARGQQILAGLAFQLFAEIRMSDRDERACALRNRFAFQIDHPILGHHVHHVGARRRHDVAVVDSRNDAAGAPAGALVGGGEA